MGDFVRTAGGSRAGRVEDSGGLGGRNRAVRSRRRPGRQGVGDRHLVCFRTGRPRRRGRGSSESPAPLRGREANARPRPAGLPGPAGRCRAAGGPWPRPRRPRPRSGAPPSPPATSAPASSAAATASAPRDCSSTSVLSEDSFTYDSTAYNITGLFVRSNGQLEFIVDVDLTTTTLADLTLVVGSTSLVLSGGTASGTVKLIL